MTAEVHIFPGAQTIGDAEPMSAETVLRGALEEPIQDVVIVARHPNGTISIWGSQPHPDTNIGLLQRGIAWLCGPSKD